MDIPIQNIYYLLCYAWNKLDEGSFVDVNKIDSTRLVDLFAKVLINGTSHLLKRGIDRSYVEYQDDLRTIRGKFNSTATIKKNILRYGKADCTFDDMSHNILHNQILKTTLYNLILLKELDTRLKDELLKVYRFFYQIDNMKLSSKAFSQVKLHRNNYFYIFLLNICELVFENILVDEESGDARFRDFIKDEKKMAYLFEEFVRNFYKMELPGYKVYREDIYWKGEKSTLLPKMQTDVTIETEDRKIIIDTKFYKEALNEYYNSKKIRSENIYQLHAYLTQVELKDEKSRKAEGILLYPTVKDELYHEEEISGHRIRFITLNLNQDWKGIHRSLLTLIQQVGENEIY